MCYINIMLMCYINIKSTDLGKRETMRGKEFIKYYSNYN